MATKKTVAKRGSTALSAAEIKKRIAEDNEAQAGTVNEGSGSKIRTSGQIFTFPDGSEDEGPISVVAVDYISKNALYPPGKFDAKNPAPPICFAIGKSVKDMRPSANSPDPQSEDCASCPMNEFGSNGDGKMCKNSRIMAVLHPDSDNLEDPLMTLEASATAIKRFDAYIGTASKLHGMPCYGVSVEVGMLEGVTYPSLTFSNIELNDNVGYHIQRRDEADALLRVEPMLERPNEPKKPAPRKKTAARRRKAA